MKAGTKEGAGAGAGAVGERAYRKALLAYEQALTRTEEALFHEMQDDPASLAKLGLPTRMPEVSLRILAKTRALSAIGESQPNRASFHRKGGSPR